MEGAGAEGAGAEAAGLEGAGAEGTGADEGEESVGGVVEVPGVKTAGPGPLAG